MFAVEIMELVSQWTNTILVWIGFGTLVGLLAKALVPGRDPGGPTVTVLMGIAGSVIGAGVLAFFSESIRVKPISILGFVVATGGAVFLLFFYHLLAGRFFREEGTGTAKKPTPRPRRKVTVSEGA